MMQGRRNPKDVRKRPITCAGHAKAFARPVRLSPLGRRQVGVTPLIRNYVEGFQKKGLKGITLARAIADDIVGFKVVPLSMEEAKKNWAQRSASEIISARNQNIMISEEAAKTGKPAIIGCTDLGLAIVASLRAAGFPTLIARAGTHTYAKFFYLGKVWIASPRHTKRLMVREMAREDKRVEDQYKAANAFAEGASLASIGIKSYDDFFKYKYAIRR